MLQDAFFHLAYYVHCVFQTLQFLYCIYMFVFISSYLQDRIRQLEFVLEDQTVVTEEKKQGDLFCFISLYLLFKFLLFFMLDSI
jgi:hypothetical protein